MFFSEHRVVSPSTVGWCGRRHEDGTVRFWDVSSSCMPHLYMLSTSHIFGEETVSSFEVASNLDTDYEWPPFRRVCTVIIIIDCCLLWMLNPVPLTKLNAAYLGYTLRMKTLFCGWPVMVMTRIREEEEEWLWALCAFLIGITKTQSPTDIMVFCIVMFIIVMFS